MAVLLASSSRSPPWATPIGRGSNEVADDGYGHLVRERAIAAPVRMSHDTRPGAPPLSAPAGHGSDRTTCEPSGRQRSSDNRRGDRARLASLGRSGPRPTHRWRPSHWRPGRGHPDGGDRRRGASGSRSGPDLVLGGPGDDIVDPGLGTDEIHAGPGPTGSAPKAEATGAVRGRRRHRSRGRFDLVGPLLRYADPGGRCERILRSSAPRALASDCLSTR